MYCITINFIKTYNASESFLSLQDMIITNSYGTMKGNVSAKSGNRP